jgi:hypothetical protein
MKDESGRMKKMEKADRILPQAEGRQPLHPSAFRLLPFAVNSSPLLNKSGYIPRPCHVSHPSLPPAP